MTTKRNKADQAEKPETTSLSPAPEAALEETPPAEQVAELEASVEIDNAAVVVPAAAETCQKYRISGLGLHGFHRAGRHWPREGVDVERGELTDVQWSALEAEPLIAIKPL